MFEILSILILSVIEVSSYKRFLDNDFPEINVIDMTYPTSFNAMADLYGSVNRYICINCGLPGLGTTLLYSFRRSSEEETKTPEEIPPEYLLTRLMIIDVSYLAKHNPTLVLSLDTALQWISLRHDPKEATLLLFKFGWVYDNNKTRSCVCKIPGISYELAKWIKGNLSHVIGVATDAPTLESEQTRELRSRTVSNLLRHAGIYVIENVRVQNIPERGCIAFAMPLMLHSWSYVPTRLTAMCPAEKTDRHVVLALKRTTTFIRPSKKLDPYLEEFLNPKA